MHHICCSPNYELCSLSFYNYYIQNVIFLQDYAPKVKNRYCKEFSSPMTLCKEWSTCLLLVPLLYNLINIAVLIILHLFCINSIQICTSLLLKLL